MSRAHEQFLTSGQVSAPVRGLVAESWRISAAAGVDADSADAPVVVGGDALSGYRDAHPLSQVFPLLYDVLGRAAEECDGVMAIADAHGQMLWVCGRPGVLARAERIHFVEGAAWDEAHAGTNAPGTALRLDQPLQILASEHFARPVQPWTCAAAPIHDPATNGILGIVDVTGSEAVATPQTLAMVRAAARMAEAELGRIAAMAAGGDITTFWRPLPRASVEALGRPDCQLTIAGRTLRLSPRHSEILVILADHPDGCTGDQLAVELYADDVSRSTMRAELTRLRSLLGDDLLDSRPYRLREEFACDWLSVRHAVDAGHLADALRAYRGPLLPTSVSPGVVERRERLERQLRAALLSSGELDLVAGWTRSRWGSDDLDMWRLQAQLAPPDTPLHTIAAMELQRLDREYGRG